MLLNSLVLPNGIWQIQLFQINQSEDSSKITIMYDNPSGQLHQRSITSAFNYNRTYSMSRFRRVKKWFPQNTFFSWFFTGRAFIMVYYIIKLDLEFQLDLQNPLKQPRMWILEKWKIIVFGQSYGIFWPKGGLKPCIIMYLGNIHNMSLVPVTFRNFFFQILQK